MSLAYCDLIEILEPETAQIQYYYTIRHHNSSMAEATGPKSKIDCSKVMVLPSEWGDGAFAACDIKKGEYVEYGLMRRLTNISGHDNPFIFTWSEDRTVWAFASGTAAFFNCAKSQEDANTEMIRHFDEDRFEIFATRDIAKGEQLMHVYRSKQWRECFSDLR